MSLYACRQGSTCDGRTWTRRSTATRYMSWSSTIQLYTRPRGRRNCTTSSSTYSLFYYRMDWILTTPTIGLCYMLFNTPQAAHLLEWLHYDRRSNIWMAQEAKWCPVHEYHFLLLFEESCLWYGINLYKMMSWDTRRPACRCHELQLVKDGLPYTLRGLHAWPVIQNGRNTMAGFKK